MNLITFDIDFPSPHVIFEDVIVVSDSKPRGGCNVIISSFSNDLTEFTCTRDWCYT